MTERKEFSEMTLAELDEFIDTTGRRIKRIEEIVTRDKAEVIKAKAWRSERVSNLSPEERTLRRRERSRSSGRRAWLERLLG